MPQEGGSRTVLVVDDDPGVLEVLDLALSAEGYEVVLAHNGREALERAAANRPNLMLVDLMMPIMDGWQFREEQRRDPALAAIPVVVLSGGDDLDGAAASLGAAASFPKPIDPDRLLETVRTLAPAEPG